MANPGDTLGFSALKKRAHVGRGHPVDEPVPMNNRPGWSTSVWLSFFAEQAHDLRSQNAVAETAVMVRMKTLGCVMSQAWLRCHSDGTMHRAYRKERLSVCYLS